MDHVRVTIHDCIVQTFRGSGAGGQNRNKRDTAVRVIHPPSGARAESCEEREQLQNKRRAFRRMAETPKFRQWALAQLDVNEVEEAVGSDIRIRTYNMIDRYVVDHRTKHKSSKVDAILGGDIDLLYN